MSRFSIQLQALLSIQKPMKPKGLFSFSLHNPGFMLQTQVSFLLYEGLQMAFVYARQAFFLRVTSKP